MDSDLMQSFGINQTETTPDAGSTEQGGGIADISSRVEQVFGTATPGQSAQPAAKPQPVPVDPKAAQPQQPAQTPVPTPPVSAQPPVATDPAKMFAEGSPKAFFTPAGELDSAKISDYFLTNGKSFMKIAESAGPEPIAATSPEERADPMKEYNEKLTYMAEHLEDEIAKRREAGATDEQINREIQTYYANARAELKQRQDLRKAIEDQTKILAPELEQARNDRINAAINKNVYELSQGLDGLVAGLSGPQVLNQFVLDPKYGGAEVDRQFLKANPGADKLDPAKRSELARKWFQDFQQDRRAMAHVAEFGRLRWMVENFKPILEHAQKVGAGMVANVKEATIGAPSKTKPTPSAAPKNSLDTFFGVDSVN